MAKGKGRDGPPNTTKCPITRRAFLEAAQPITVMIDGVAHSALPLENTTGSFGWNVNAKMIVKVGGINVPIQVGCNFTVIGSKSQER